MLSSRQVVDLAVEIERELLSISAGLTDFLPLIRMHLYFSQRPKLKDSLDVRQERLGPISRFLFAVGSNWRVFMAWLLGVPGKQLFLAPANQRNVPENGFFISKHLDSLLREYGCGRDTVWEIEPIPDGRGVEHSLTSYVTRVSRLIVAFQPTSGKLREVEAIIRRVVDSSPEEFEWDIDALTRLLSVFEVSRRIYVHVFRRSNFSKAYVVCYYGAAQFSILAALNDLGIETIEYQHGMQSNVQPMYTRWEHLPRPPQSMPRRILVWDQVSKIRISLWASALEIEVDQVGNLWYATNGYTSLPSSDSVSILVALQVYPEFFNFEILKAMALIPDIQWVFREHPHSLLSEEDKAYLYSCNGGLKIVHPTEEALEESLERCSICITGFSTVGLEALMCNRKAIFTHVNAAEGLKDYFDGKNCFYADRAEEIVRLVRDLSTGRV